MPSVIELRKVFDPTRWLVAAPGARPSSTLLFTWTVEPEPTDAGIPLLVRTVLAEALCVVGTCWFAGDEGTGVPAATLNLRRGLTWHRSPMFRADHSTGLLKAFESGAHDWSMAAQWIVVGVQDGVADDKIVPLLRTLLAEWKIPDDWPADVLAIVQAGVDGDAAGCHCRTPDVEAVLRRALQERATVHGVAIHVFE